jgi:hypothetical protein
MQPAGRPKHQAEFATSHHHGVLPMRGRRVTCTKFDREYHSHALLCKRAAEGCIFTLPHAASGQNTKQAVRLSASDDKMESAAKVTRTQASYKYSQPRVDRKRLIHRGNWPELRAILVVQVSRLQLRAVDGNTKDWPREDGFHAYVISAKYTPPNLSASTTPNHTQALAS